MNIAIIGTGQVGGRLAKSWAAKGHRIFLGTRDVNSVRVGDLLAAYPDHISAHTADEAAHHGEIVVLALPSSSVREIASRLGDMGGKIIVDTVNSVFRQTEPYVSSSRAIAEIIGNDHVVKCFNCFGAESIDNPDYGNDTADMLLCGEYAEDKETVARLAEDIGFRVYDIGGIDQERVTEYAALVWAALAFGAGLGRDSAFKVLSR